MRYRTPKDEYVHSLADMGRGVTLSALASTWGRSVKELRKQCGAEHWKDEREAHLRALEAAQGEIRQYVAEDLKVLERLRDLGLRHLGEEKDGEGSTAPDRKLEFRSDAELFRVIIAAIEAQQKMLHLQDAPPEGDEIVMELV